MEKVYFLPQLRVGSLELRRLQELIEKNIRAFSEATILNYGLIVSKDFQGNITNDWRVTAVNNRTIQVNSGKAFVKDADGNMAYVKLENPFLIEMPLVDNTYKILLRHVYTHDEIGTISINNNTTTVIGNGTEFTKVFASNRRIIFGGNIYIVSNVVSDTELELADVYTGLDVSGVKYQVGGYFSEYPIGIEDNKIYIHDAVEISVTTNAPNVNDIYLADVTITNGWVVNVVDKRSQFYVPYQEYPQLNETHIRDRREVIYRQAEFCSQTVNADIQGIQPQINADDNHGLSFSSKFAIKFYKGVDDTTINLTYTPIYTNGGSLTDIDKTKWKVRLSIPQVVDSAEFYLSTTTLTLDISNLPVGYYELHFQLAKVTTAYNLSIHINEIYLQGGKHFIV